MGVTLGYLAFCVAWLVYYISLPYNDPKQLLPKWSVWSVTVLYVVFLYVFMGIKYSRVRRYYKMLTYVSTGLKHEETNYFYCFDEKSLQKERLMRELKQSLSDREYQVLCLRFGLKNGVAMPQREVAELMQISRSYISRIEKKAIEKLKKYQNQL